MKSIRHKIDAIDDRILELLIERLELAKGIGKEKAAAGLAIYDPRRERDILARLTEENSGRLDNQAILAVWREIFSASRQAIILFVYLHS